MSSMKTFDAYTLHTADSDEAYAIVWWNGSKLCANTTAILASLKRQIVDGMDYTSGEDFFKKIPMLFKNGYTYAKKAKVNEEGKVV